MLADLVYATGGSMGPLVSDAEVHRVSAAALADR